ncbi:MAG: hypothetical protein M3R53_01610 [Candidatus Eremiobacteraeota bacterium]|nr:hypothetical protein [Candidatus Eremiobacteraeota bacterium]
MLGFALLLSTVLANPIKVAVAPGPVQAPHAAACPSVPSLPFAASAQACPALEISGHVDASGVVLDPAFQVVVAAAQLSRPGRADSVVSGYGADGRSIFSFTFEAKGPFHLFLPLAPAAAQSLARLHLSTAIGSSEQVPVAHAEPDAEVIAVDDAHVLFAWNARTFPAIRISNAPGAPPVAVGTGSSTYQEMTFASSARRLVVDFSDGVHSATRTFRVFGRT